jgi:NADPH:quinone reductase-like Zn-dependent oxidoreductase
MNAKSDMLAASIIGHGGNEVVVVGARPIPEPGAGEVRVRLQAATVNRVDLYMRDSGAGITHTLPQILGLDGAGTVDAVGSGVTSVRPGDAVVLHPGIGCGRCEFCQRGEDVLCTRYQLLGEHRDGTFAEYVVLPADNVFPRPPHLPALQAAALGVNYLTAWRMLFSKAHVRAGEHVLVFGVGGGVSLAGLQLAKAAGAHVIVTSRDAAKRERALAMGADAAIDSSGDIAHAVLAQTQGRGVDVVFENVGAAVWAQALKSLVRGGRLVTCGATTGDQPGADLRRLFIRQISVLGSTLGTRAEFAELLAFVERHHLEPVIDSVFELSEVPAALSRLASGQQFGKVALHIAD